MAAKSSNGCELARLCPSCDSFRVYSEEFGNLCWGKQHLLFSRSLHTHSACIVPFAPYGWKVLPLLHQLARYIECAYIACSKAATFLHRFISASYPCPAREPSLTASPCSEVITSSIDVSESKPDSPLSINDFSR